MDKPVAPVNTTYIFTYSAGREAMENLFGRIKGRTEMFKLENGLLTSKDAEKTISFGFMATVPSEYRVPCMHDISIMHFHHNGFDRKPST